MKALILCAGFGTRLGDLTREIPKPLLDIAGEPLLAYTLRYLASQGLNELAINVHYRASQIRAFVGDGSRFGVTPHLVEEHKPLGTAGAVRNMESFFASEDKFFVIYGDLLIDQDLKPMIEQHDSTNADATLLVHQRAVSNSVVRIDDNWRITEFLERPENLRSTSEKEFVNSGVYLLSRQSISCIPDKGASDFPRDVFPRMIEEKKRLFAFPLSGYRCAIDSPERYQEAVSAVKDGRYSNPTPRPTA